MDTARRNAKSRRGRDDEQRLTTDIIALARQYGRYGYRKIAGLLRQAGWAMTSQFNASGDARGSRSPASSPSAAGCGWPTDHASGCGPQHRDHVWSYDFVEDRTHDGRRYRMLNVLDEFTHECLAIRVARRLKAIDVIDVLSDLFILRGIPVHIRSDNGPEFVAEAVREWIRAVGAKTAYIERGSPWENGYIESFNARLRDELLDGEIFYSPREAQTVIESRRRHYNRIRPHAVHTTSTRGVRARAHRVAGCATSNGSAGHAGAQANLKLTFHLDYSVGADHPTTRFAIVPPTLSIATMSISAVDEV